MRHSRLCIVVPCFCEEAVLPETEPVFLKTLKDLIRAGLVSEDSSLLFVDDGSRDRTWSIIERFCQADSHVRGLSLSRNRGHQNALLAGLMEARAFCDLAISADCDGQDDLSVMQEMVTVYRNGADIVYGVRNSRDTDGFFKRVSAECFYRFMKRMGTECIRDHADYRLASRRVLNELAGFREVNLFLRGMFPLVGFSSTCVYYRRQKRVAGRSHYPLKKMTAFAVDGITSFSVKPLHLIAGTGLLLSFLSAVGICYALISFLTGRAVSGWASIVCIVCLIGGIQLLSLGVIGEYIGKIYLETKQRPRYIIRTRTWDSGEEEET